MSKRSSFFLIHLTLTLVGKR